jgi:predicted XRE-type DNA-binding protein
MTTKEGTDAMKDEDFELVEGSGNIFRDFGDPEADLKQAKAILAARIIAVLDERGLSVRKAARMTGFAAADFSRIRNANLGRFTLDRMMRMIGALDDHMRVTIHVGVRAKDPATTARAAAGP